MSSVVAEQRRREGVELAPVPAAEPIPPELLLRRDRDIRYERGGKVYATDGLVGILKQVVVDEAAGEVVALVVAVGGAPGRRILLPPDLVDKTGGSAVFLTVNRARFAEGAAAAPPFEQRRFARANLKALRHRLAEGRTRRPGRLIVQLGKDYVETPAAPLLDRAPTGGR